VTSTGPKPWFSGNRKYWTLYACVVGISVVAVPLIWLRWGDPGGASSLGDFFGSAGALFSGLAFVALLRALSLQRQALEMQREELGLQREELRLTRQEMERSSDALQTQVALLRDERVAAEASRLRGLTPQLIYGRLEDRGDLGWRLVLKNLSPRLECVRPLTPGVSIEGTGESWNHLAELGFLFERRSMDWSISFELSDRQRFACNIEVRGEDVLVRDTRPLI
jgi:hypothetical protein